MTNATSTQAPPPDPILLKYQVYTRCVAILNARAPHKADAIIADACHESADRFAKKLQHMKDASGMRKGPPDYRREVFTMKSQMEAQQGLWAAQRQEYPKRYDEDAVDAYELGSLLPVWVTEDAIRAGAKRR